MGPPPPESELCSVGSVWSLPLPAHRQTHSLTLIHTLTRTHTLTHTHTHAHGQTYAHMCTCTGDTRTQSHRHADKLTHTQTYTLCISHGCTCSTHIHTYLCRQDTIHTRVHPYTQTGTHARTHVCTGKPRCTHVTRTYAQSPAQGPFARGWKVLGAERQRNGGWGSKTSEFLSVESPQHLGAGTREERPRWGRRWIWEEGRWLVLRREQRRFQRVSKASWVLTGVLTRARED